MFKPQLSENVEKVKEGLYFPKLLSVKLDGIRCLTVEGGAYSRSLKPIPNRHIRSIVSAVQHLDGELIVGPPNADNVCNVTTSAVMSHDGQPEFKFYVFDDLSRLDLPFADRLKLLQDRSLPSFVHVLEQTKVYNLVNFNSYYEDRLDEGYEGLIARNPDSMYKFGRCTARSQDSLKMKPFSDDEAVVLGFYEAMFNDNEAFTDELGRTKRSTAADGLVGKDTLGGFEVQDVQTGALFKVGPGKLKHDERKHIWDSREKYLKKVLKYRHMTVGAINVPRQGRWVAWRDPLDMS